MTLSLIQEVGEDRPVLPEALSAQQRWQQGFGVIVHTPETIARVTALVEHLAAKGGFMDRDSIWEKLIAADRLASSVMWLVVHMTYTRTIDFSERSLEADDFKKEPEGHTGGSLNMAVAYVGYLLANVLTGKTRSWVMGQGHCVAAIEAANVLMNNLLPEQARRYSCSSDGLTRLVQDFYSYAIDSSGNTAAPIGSHVNAQTAGGTVEGGYLGFVETTYVHMPLKGESLVAFLSDGAFEEQRGADWSPRWWRASDCGLVAPIMILNGRRIEERSAIEQAGGASWLHNYLRINGFDPIEIDGRDPAAFAWAILEMEDRLQTAGKRVEQGDSSYPVPLPYTIAKTIKGYGFPGSGTNRAHNLPLLGNPHNDLAARKEFNSGVTRLFVPLDELNKSIDALSTHGSQDRPLERDHPLARRNIETPALPEPDWQPTQGAMSPMDAVDSYFVRIVQANPRLRPRVGNPDELKSNHMGRTLAVLKHRANNPEAGVDEAVNGAVITALNEEAVIGAALGNKGGINLAVSYEAFAVKMLGALRQDIIFARHQKEAGRPPRWLGVPLIVSSHTWENGKNEQSHQDPTLAEALQGEMSDVARVLFPVDANSALESLRSVYRSHGVIACLVIPKRERPNILSATQAQEGLLRGAVTIASSENPIVQFVAIGSYQLSEAMQAHRRLEQAGFGSRVTVAIEPARLRQPRDELEASFVLSDREMEALFPRDVPRVLVTHTRPEPMLGLLRRFNNGPSRCRAVGYRNRGGTLDVGGMLFANGCSWAHLIREVEQIMGHGFGNLLSDEERRALAGQGDPRILFQ